MSTAPEYFDLGRAEQPPEPEHDLRPQLLQEVNEDLCDIEWLRKRIIAGGRVGTNLLVALTLRAEGEDDSQEFEEIRDLEVERRARES